MFVFAVIEREEKLNGGGCEEEEADEVEFVADGVSCGFDGGFGGLVWDVDADQEDGYQCADGEVDVEAL